LAKEAAGLPFFPFFAFGLRTSLFERFCPLAMVRSFGHELAAQSCPTRTCLTEERMSAMVENRHPRSSAILRQQKKEAVRINRLAQAPKMSVW
jgi:hypothetical protein